MHTNPLFLVDQTIQPDVRCGNVLSSLNARDIVSLASSRLAKSCRTRDSRDYNPSSQQNTEGLRPKGST